MKKFSLITFLLKICGDTSGNTICYSKFSNFFSKSSSNAEQKEENRRKINARMETEILTTNESPKDKLLKEILKKENIS